MHIEHAIHNMCICMHDHEQSSHSSTIASKILIQVKENTQAYCNETRDRKNEMFFIS